MAYLEVKGLGKSFARGGGTLEVLSNVSLSVEKGELVAIVGYSGSGKTTLVSLLAGLIEPDTGSIVLDGKPVSAPGRDRAVVFQSYGLLPWMTVRQNVALAVDASNPELPKAERAALVEKYIALVGLAHAHDRKPAQLSGGMKQRVAVARALSTDPDVLLLDEPFGALDALTRAGMQREIARLVRESGKTAVLITNDVEEAILLADRIIPLSAGPSATLLDPVPVPFAFPRDRRELSREHDYKAIRAHVLATLIASSKKRPVAPETKSVAIPHAEEVIA
jgi:nitrate/nitrite transport system ATP-binding protein